MYKRSIVANIKGDLGRKIVLLSGPRQCGKTTLAKTISKDFDYLNFDQESHRKIIRSQSWDRAKSLVIFDELHKMRNWKRWLKGIYDTEGVSPQILVTGSARLDITKKMGDSLAGRYLQHRLFPLDSIELKGQLDAQTVYDRLKEVGGFPEPFSESKRSYYERWSKSHLDIILRQDLLEMGSVTDIRSIEVLIELLKDSVGTPISYASLARDISRDPKTVKRWIEVLESLFIVFRITPYAKDIKRSVRKEPKIYFYDVAQLSERPAAQIENIVALSLYKESTRLIDSEGIPSKVHFLKIKDGKEIDFLWIQKNKTRLIEVKKSDDSLSSNFKVFTPFFKSPQCIQLVDELSRAHTFPGGERIVSIVKWFSEDL